MQVLVEVISLPAPGSASRRRIESAVGREKSAAVRANTSQNSSIQFTRQHGDGNGGRAALMDAPRFSKISKRDEKNPRWTAQFGDERARV